MLGVSPLGTTRLGNTPSLQALATGPAIAVAPGALSFSCTVGQTPAAQQLAITNSGSGGDTALATLGLSIAYTTGAGWFAAAFDGGDTVSPTTATASCPGAAALAVGQYRATLSLDDDDATNAPRTVAIVLDVLPLPSSPVIRRRPPLQDLIGGAMPIAYGRAATIAFDRFASASPYDLKTDAAVSAGEAQLSIDGGAFADVTNLPTAVNGRWQWIATAAETAGREIVLRIVQTGYLTQPVVLRTAGDARGYFPAEGQIHSTSVSLVASYKRNASASDSFVLNASGESRARCRISSEYALPMPLKSRGSVSVRLSV